MAVTNTASAKWSGGLKDGSGSLSTGSGVFKEQPYSFKKRFEGEAGTNPEELIAAAHAGCFTMALSKILGEAGMTADSLETTAKVILDQVDGGFAVTKIELSLDATIPGADQGAFEGAAVAAKEGCPISKLLDTEITLSLRLNDEALAA